MEAHQILKLGSRRSLNNFSTFLQHFVGRVFACRPSFTVDPDRRTANTPAVAYMKRVITFTVIFVVALANKETCVPFVDDGIRHFFQPGINTTDLSFTTG